MSKLPDCVVKLKWYLKEWWLLVVQVEVYGKSLLFKTVGWNQYLT